MTRATGKNLQRKDGSAEVLAVIAGHFEQSLTMRQSKHLRVRNAILEAIADAQLDRGDQIPPELELCAALSVSLGTVQRALRELSLDGVLVREHGRGTFVADYGLRQDEVWQFRFRSPGTKGFLPVTTVVVAESVVSGPGPWEAALGPDREGYLRIVRIISVAGGVDCYNELYFRMSKFGAMRKIAMPKLRNINIKSILAKEFNAPTLSIEQLVRAAPIPEPALRYLDQAAGTVGVDVHVVGQTYGREPIFLQKIWFPAGEHYMDMTHEENIKVTAGGVPMGKLHTVTGG
ncbi:MAG: GntR family transcriptional regulator [Hyphomicrobiales bacterium]|nr:GntR family transcriptional regulator [Hyphomicrobiales bacterium]MCP5370982.1 GntR family transcriptional regulator [Hyphomicrobiales bacterium]